MMLTYLMQAVLVAAAMNWAYWQGVASEERRQAKESKQ